MDSFKGHIKTAGSEEKREDEEEEEEESASTGPALSTSFRLFVVLSAEIRPSR